MVRFLAPALLVVPAAGDALLHESVFTNMPDGERRLTKQEACTDLVNAFVDESKTSCSELDKDAAMRACMDAAYASIDCNKEKCSWYDEAWRAVGSFEAAVKGVASQGYYTCTGADACFIGDVKQKRFYAPGGKADLCASVAKELVAKNPDLPKNGYAVKDVQRDCETAVNSKKEVAGKIKEGCEKSWCVIDTQEQQCLTALTLNDIVEMNFRKGCKCKPQTTCKRGLKECVAELAPGKEWAKVEVVVVDDAEEDGSRNEVVRDLSEAVTCLKDIQEKEKNGKTGKSAGCSIHFPPAFFTS